MTTRKRIESGSDIWEAALTEVPVDDSGPRWEERTPPPAAAVWAVIGLALLANAGFVIVVVKIWDWLT